MALDLDDSGSEYNDLDVQHINANTNFGLADTSVLMRNEIDPVGGILGRDELAELVALSAAPWIFLGGTDTQVEGHGRYQLGTEPQVRFNHGGFGSGSASNDEIEILDYTGATDPDGQLSGYVTEDVESDVWLQTQPHNHGPLYDTTSGAGAGGTNHMPHLHINFRDHFGTGPVLDRHDHIYEVMNLESVGTVEECALYRNVTMYWDVHEKD